jgi:4-hydroxybenzoate polyprenyltransferase
VGGILWTIVYDSIYAFQDREFDKKLGLRSTAIEMEHDPHRILSVLAASSVSCFALGGLAAGLAAPFYLGLGGVAAHYIWQIKTLDTESRQSCWDRFQSNRWLGLLLVISILAGRFYKPKSKEANETQ